LVYLFKPQEKINFFQTKGGGGKTVSSFYKQQLDSLMTTLYATEPHFIRCIIPNNNKMPGQVSLTLVFFINGIINIF
jgi:myosin heavy subunit